MKSGLGGYESSTNWGGTFVEQSSTRPLGHYSIDDLVVKKTKQKKTMGLGEKNKFKVAVNHSRKERSPVCFNRNLYNALPKEILKCDKYIDFRRQLSKSLSVLQLRLILK